MMVNALPVITMKHVYPKRWQRSPVLCAGSARSSAVMPGALSKFYGQLPVNITVPVLNWEKSTGTHVKVFKDLKWVSCGLCF